MLVYTTNDRLRLIKQHHHGMVAGWLAFAWHENNDSLPFELVLAISIHDLAWSEMDEKPLFNFRTGLPYDFTNYPEPMKSNAYSKGISQIVAIHPYAGLLASLHYSKLGGTEEFQKSEKERQQKLKQQLSISRENQELVNYHLEFLRFFDAVSLSLCLTPPCAVKTNYPDWLKKSHWNTPDDRNIVFYWQNDNYVTMNPYPFKSPLQLNILCYELPQKKYRDNLSLQFDWKNVRSVQWPIRIGPSKAQDLSKTIRHRI